VNGVFRSHDTSAGATLWSKDFTWDWSGYSMNRTVACAGKAAFFISVPSVGTGPQLVKVDLTTKAILWSVSQNSITGTPAVGTSSVFALAGSNIVEFDRTTGVLVRTYVTGGPNTLVTQPILTADTLVAASSSHTYLFNYGTTSPRQTIPFGGEISVASKSVFIASSNGTIRRYGTLDADNPVPVATPATVATLEDTPLTITLAGIDASPLQFLVNTLPTQGALFQTLDGVTPGAAITKVPMLVTNAQGRVIYRPATNTNGPGIGNFTFRAHDGNAPSASAAITVNVTAVNDAPVAINDIVAIRPGESLTAYLPQLNDRDPDGENLTVVSFTQPDQGSVTAAANGGIHFTPAGSFVSGSTSFQYTIRDAGLVTAKAMVTLQLTGPTGLDWPTLGVGPDHTSFQPVLIGTATLSESWASKPGSSARQVAVAGDRVFVSSYSTGAALIALDASTGGETWRKSYAGTSSINPTTWHGGSVIYQVQDGPSQTSHVVALNGADGSQQWSSIFYQQWENYLAPAVDDTGVYITGGSYGGIYGYERDTGGQRFFQSLDQYDEWTPSLHNGGLYSFVKGIFRSHSRSTGAIQWSRTFAWDWAGYDMKRTTACANNTAFFINDTDSQGYPKPRDLISLDLTTQQVRWTASNFAFSGTPALAHGNVYAYASSTTVEAYDQATGALIAVYTAPANAALSGQPIITADTVIACGSTQTFLFNLQTRVLRQTLPAGGYASVAGRCVYVASSDGTVRCYQSPDALNPAPAVASTSVTTAEDTPVTVNLAATDSGNSTFKFVITQMPARGQLYQVAATGGMGALISNVPALVSDPQGRLTYLPPPNQNGSSLGSFGFKASDGNSLSSAALLTIHVTPVNDPPVARADYAQVRPGDILSPLLVKANDGDVDGDSLTITSFTQPPAGVVALNTDGTLRFESSGSISSGTHTFTYTIADAVGVTATASVSVTYGESAGGEWSTFGNGPDHSGFSSAPVNRSALTQRWVYNTSAGSRQVAVAEGKVFVSTIQSSLPVLVALNEKTGALVWSRQLQTVDNGYGTSINSPSFYNGRLYVQCGQQSSAQLVSVNSADGVKEWGKPVTCQWSSYMAPAVSDLGVFINGGTYGGMYGFELDGTQKFFVSLAQVDQWTPSLHQGSLYSLVRRTFRSHALSSGVASWTLNLNPDSSAYSMNRTAAFADGKAVLVDTADYYTSNTSLVCVDTATQQIVWRAAGTFAGTPAVSSGTVYVIDSSGKVQAYSIGDGSLQRTYTVGSTYNRPAHPAPVVTDELLFAPQTNSVLVFGRQDGVLLQTIPYGGEIAVADDQLIISTSDKVYAFGQARTITFSPAGGTFTSAQNITLTASDSSATIRYTTDGSAPNLGSPTVASGSSVLMNHTGKLRAITVKGSSISRVSEASYTITAPASGSAMAMSRSLLPAGGIESVAAADFDRDGQSDLAEAVAGTNPRDAGDVFHINHSSLTAEGTDLRISWPSKSGRSYRVQRSTDLQTWVDVTASIPGTGAEITKHLPAPASGACFLRVRVE